MNIPKSIKLSQLKGLSIYFQDDLYQTAKLLLTLYDARREKLGEPGIKRPTVHGLVRTFASLSDVCNPRREYVERIVAQKKWKPNATIKFDDEV